MELPACEVIGSCGGPAKCKSIVSTYGFDHAIDRKTLPEKAEDGGWQERKDELKRRLKQAAPDGIDMYFDNVGQDHFEAAFESLRKLGRIAVCGGIAGLPCSCVLSCLLSPRSLMPPGTQPASAALSRQRSNVATIGRISECLRL